MEVRSMETYGLIAPFEGDFLFISAIMPDKSFRSTYFFSETVGDAKKILCSNSFTGYKLLRSATSFFFCSTIFSRIFIRHKNKFQKSKSKRQTKGKIQKIQSPASRIQ